MSLLQTNGTKVWCVAQRRKEPDSLQRLIFLSIVVVLLLSAGLSFGLNSPYILLDFDGKSAENGLPAPWYLKIKEGKAYAATAVYNNRNILHLKSSSSSFAVERDIDISPESFPYLSWSWLAVRLPVSGDVRKRDYNDQALQVLVAFENRRIISYVWDSNAPEGTIVEESIGWPVDLRIKVIVVKSGSAETGKWQSDTHDVRQDYISLFGEKPPKIKGIRIQMNTQYTKDKAEGFVQRLLFSSTPVATDQLYP